MNGKNTAIGSGEGGVFRECLWTLRTDTEAHAGQRWIQSMAMTLGHFAAMMVAAVVVTVLAATVAAAAAVSGIMATSTMKNPTC